MLSVKSTPNWLQISKFIALFFFVITPILAGITAGLVMNSTLFWLWICVGFASLIWFIGAVVAQNQMKVEQQRIRTVFTNYNSHQFSSQRQMVGV